MRINRHKRQVLLFLAAVLMPASALIGLTGRIVYQDRELAAKRAIDQRQAASRIHDSTIHVIAKTNLPVGDVQGLILAPEMTIAEAPQLDRPTAL